LPEDRGRARRPPPTHRTTVIPIDLLSSVSDSVTQGSPALHRGITRNERRRALERLRMRLGGIRGTHMYSQPRTAGFLARQQEFSAANPWFSGRQLNGVTHFPALEIPDATAAEIEHFLG